MSQGLAKRIEWIKSLVMSLVNHKNDNANKSSGNDRDDLVFQQNFPSMIQIVLDSIQAAKQLMNELNAGDNANLIPQSVSTDLQLLEYVIRTQL